ncbi:MAG: deoxynucleoside kinase [Candidatus Marinimicrobia bacterium]|nr:deoxynucleoside kinase [Candidatus Neomarinimicrobiota bacterium]MCF7827677.1 deoxynucleoside kinase [Candidatus Neomarinimicrobiota bacterium]MCF7881268.1 deoxynucleoside kinase [Candidatus Neomarinimicrobiota bacterium]
MTEQSTYFVGIAGNIGVGKTTLTDIIADRFGWKPFYESVIDNPYLDDFYANMRRWSFNLQVYFLSKRFETHKRMTEGDFSAVQDRTIYEDVEIFAYNLHQMGNMTTRDYQNYRDLFGIMTEYLKKPDLIIYLKASTDTLISRIRRRGREFEKRISPEYLHQLNVAYERWIKNAKDDIPIHIVDADNFNVFEDTKKVNQLMQVIESYCPGESGSD